MKIIIVIFLFVLSKSVFGQITKSDLLKKAEAYYGSLNSFSIKVREERKSAIDIKPSIWEYYCYVDETNKTELFNISKNSGYLVKAGNEFDIKYGRATFTAVTKKKKDWIYYQKFSRLPFIDFDYLKKEIHKTLLYVDSTDSTYLLKGDNSFYEFRKSNGSIFKIYRGGKDDKFTGGDYFEEITFDFIQSDFDEITSKISSAESIINSNNREIVSSFETPETFDLKLLQDTNLKWLNFNPGLLKGKKILIDVFFQGCFPCVKSYPYLAELNANKDSNTLILGIDSVPEDSLTAEAYLKKYNIRYPVLTGEMAGKLARILNVSSWPTMVLIDEKDKILLYHTGFSPAGFKRVRKILEE